MSCVGESSTSLEDGPNFLHAPTPRTTIHRNAASVLGGGIALEGTAVLSCDHCDLGEGTDDNTPDDVAISADIGWWVSGTNASFDCDASLGECSL